MNDVFKIDEIFFIDLGLSDLAKKFKTERRERSYSDDETMILNIVSK